MQITTKLFLISSNHHHPKPYRFHYYKMFTCIGLPCVNGSAPMRKVSYSSSYRFNLIKYHFTFDTVSCWNQVDKNTHFYK
jgi:hypothetical protein